MNQRQNISRLVSALTLLSLCLLGVPLAVGQAKLTTADSFFAAQTNFQSFLNHPRLQLLPSEVAEAVGKEYFGVNFRELLAITAMARAPGKDDMPMVVVLRFKTPQTLGGKTIENFFTKKELLGRGTLYSRGTSRYDISVLQVSPTLIAIGTESTLEAFQTKAVKGTIGKMLVKNSLGTDISFYVDQQLAKFMWDGAEKSSDEYYELPSELDDCFELATLVHSFEAGVKFVKNYEITIAANCANQEDALRAQKILVGALKYLQKQHLRFLKEKAAKVDFLEGPANRATLAYFRRIHKKYKTELTPKIEGNRLVLKLDHRHKYLPIALGMIISQAPDLGVKRKIIPRLAMSQILRAMRQYQVAHEQLPSIMLPFFTKDEPVANIFNARFGLTPFIKQVNKTRSLDISKGWANRTTTEKQNLPTYYGKTILTRFRFPVLYLDDEQAINKNSASSLMPRERIKYEDFEDGLSNSIMLIHAPEDKAIEWSQPKLWVLDNHNLIKSVFGERDEVTVGMASGSVHVIQRSKITEEGLLALLTRAGGEVVDINDFK